MARVRVERADPPHQLNTWEYVLFGGVDRPPPSRYFQMGCRESQFEGEKKISYPERSGSRLENGRKKTQKRKRKKERKGLFKMIMARARVERAVPSDSLGEKAWIVWKCGPPTTEPMLQYLLNMVTG
ncbi:hypothetical protein B0H13DRAFT_1862978 [Mycena leptocephala]|nr:hypothetical protein B0H13DRAFT_1862978 [Mycena leptocephala]